MTVEPSESEPVKALPEDIACFIEKNIGSVDQLEILRILALDRKREWPTAVLARVLQSQPQTVCQHLDFLERLGLVTASHGHCLSYRYGPHTPELETTVSRLLQFYNERPVTMIRMVYERA